MRNGQAIRVKPKEAIIDALSVNKVLCLHAVSCDLLSCHVHAPFCTHVYTSEAAMARDRCDIATLNTLEVFSSPVLRWQVL